MWSTIRTSRAYVDYNRATIIRTYLRIILFKDYFKAYIKDPYKDYYKNHFLRPLNAYDSHHEFSIQIWPLPRRIRARRFQLFAHTNWNPLASHPTIHTATDNSLSHWVQRIDFPTRPNWPSGREVDHRILDGSFRSFPSSRLPWPVNKKTGDCV